ncbi:MAG: fluoride efflux transporter CrcB [Candidatus Omnitrophica bacterium]|nr:fluoride efflux transporter CrcB [Candidatus Omnitrophota bacterium]MCF7887747.1 fluoride efflux transporter CrcB [Candidatus Omnitrophota bacterium]MCF7898293.1 fluoride efflux transporter CrcB [Candidatus Omnitrophota bacterium]
MLKLFNIAIGGAAGALLRYWVSGLTYRFFSGGFPWGTLSVNLVGSLLIGLFWGIFDSIAISQNLKLFIFIGLLGSFTTFSTFSLENFHLLRDGEYWFVFFNVVLSLFLGISLVFIGFFISKLFLGILK